MATAGTVSVENLMDQANIWTESSRSSHEGRHDRAIVAKGVAGGAAAGCAGAVMESSTARLSLDPGPEGEAQAWSVIRGLAHFARGPGFDPGRFQAFRSRPNGDLVPLAHGEFGWAEWCWRPGHGWAPGPAPLDPEIQVFADLYLPVCGVSPPGCLAVGHLGQSLDGFIATGCGDSFYVTGPENIRHLHRMRALSDGVLVGTETAACDDPRLTTRLVPGDNPVRVILDRQRRLPPGLHIFTDGAAETLLCCDRQLVRPGQDRQGQARVLGVPCRAGRLDLRALMEALTERGLRRLFVEGGGALVSAFLSQGLLDRLQLTVAPLVIGTGRPGLRVPAPDRLSDARRPPVRLFQMGSDLLYDLDLRRQAGSHGTTEEARPPLVRVF
jgi:riboflavin-specific deaminase-like protein